MEPPDLPPQGVPDIEAIASLDTARMALRWALERLQKLEREKAELADRASGEERARAKAIEELGDLKRTLALRTAEAAQRQSYYSKMEAFLSLRLEGKLDLATLVKRELEVKELQEVLEARQGSLERDYAARKEALEAEFRVSRAEADEEAKASSRRAEGELERRRSALEAEFLAKRRDLAEKEATLKQEDHALAERRTRFEEYYTQQRARLHAELRGFREEIDAQVRLRAELFEKTLGERQASLDEGWSRERAMLLKELSSWRAKAQELGPRLLELEKDLDVAEEAAKRARSAADRQTLILADYQQAWEAEKAALEAENVQWKSRAKEQLAKLQDLGKRLVLAEESLQQTQNSAELQISVLEERVRALQKAQDEITASLRKPPPPAP